MKGSRVLVTVDPAFQKLGNATTVWVDYPNIIRVVPVGGRIYIDDGLISLVVTKIGADPPPVLAKRHTLFLSAPAFALQTHHLFPWPLFPGVPGIQIPGLTLGWGGTGGLVVSSPDLCLFSAFRSLGGSNPVFLLRWL